MDTIEESVDMSNLGGYQKLTTFAKKVGGPGNLVSSCWCNSGKSRRVCCKKRKTSNYQT